MIEEPFAISNNCWEGVKTSSVPLYVPEGTKELYVTTAGWNQFKNIKDERPDRAYAIIDNGMMTLYYDNETRAGTLYNVPNGTCRVPTLPDVWSPYIEGYTYGHPWYKKSEEVKTIVIDPSFALYRPTCTYCWFTNFNATEIKGLEYLNTSEVTDMRYMFAGCEYLTQLDLSHLFVRENALTEALCRACLKLESVTLNASFSSLGKEAFVRCRKLTSINIPSSVTSIGREALLACNSLTSILIPSNVTSIGDEAFRSCGLTEAISKIEEPFTINPNVWKDVDTENIPLYVPAGTKDIYRATEGWNVFNNIIEVFWGDVNNDGSVTPADAIMMLYHYFGMEQNGFNVKAGDLNGDSVITPADAIEALYIYFGGGKSGNARGVRPTVVNVKEPE